ncbi:MAG: ankyrin repeat domain-containing protein [Candidatus Aureabacteria bacterium]|nr:ankyrin repeat domain-containing protein [Candidatus Auribacterota bacterium]
MKNKIVLLITAFLLVPIFSSLYAGEEDMVLLMKLIDANDVAGVQNIVQDKKNLNELYISDTPLSLACKKGSKEIVKCLLDNGADPKEKDGSYTPPIISAFKNKEYKDIVFLLIDAGADVSSEDNDYNSPLTCALKKYTDDKEKSLELMKLLLDAGAYVDALNEMGYTPLMIACKMDDAELVSLFVKFSANVNFQNKDTTTPLKLSKSKEITKILKDKGAME